MSNLKTPVLRGNGEIGCGHGYDGCAHLRVDITKDVRHPRLRKANFSRSAAFIKSKIKRFSVIDGKHVVKKRILIGKFNLSTHANRYYMRKESLILLN